MERLTILRLTGQAMYSTCIVTLRRVRANIVEVEGNDYYTTRVCVVLGSQYVLRVRHVVICGLTRSTIFSHIINGKI